MSEIKFKSAIVDARFSKIHQKLQLICHEMAAFCESRKMPFVLTETRTTAAEDKALNRVSSSHREGRAVDIRTIEWAEEFRHLFMDNFERAYGDIGAITAGGGKALLVYHDNGHGEHIHCQLNSSFKNQTQGDL